MAFSDTRKWNAFWISFGKTQGDWRSPDFPAPCFRKEFEWHGQGEAKLYVCGLGFHEVRLNGRKVSDVELAPAQAKYDAHAGYLVYDAAPYLKAGRNTIAVMLGNGLYNCQTPDTWHFDKATWRDYPKLLLELVADGETVVSSDDTWKFTLEGPITFNALRNGESYDARKELTGWDENGFDDAAWPCAVITAGPGGLLYEQTSAPCRVTDLFPMTLLKNNVWDAKQNIAGRAEITVSGTAGSEIVIRYGDVLDENGALYLKNIAFLVKGGEFQTEHYILKGEGTEVWHSRFTYHGFRYAEITVKGEVKIRAVTAQAIHSDVAQVGDFECSNPDVNALKHCTLWSYVNNLVGIPTDCPHREKNGWMNDTQLASDTGLFLFDGKETYREWLGTIRDCMRPNGELPGMAPTSGWGYNWGNGTMFDTALFGIPRNIYVYRGDAVPMRENYEPFKKTLAFTETLAKKHIVRFGLGDWKHPFRDKAVTPALPNTAWYYHDLRIFAEAAQLFGYEDDFKFYSEKAEAVKEAFNREFSNGGGSYANDEKTALAVAVYFGFCAGDEAKMAVQRLLASVRKDAHVADFGIVGAKFVPRVLAEHGFADDGLKIFTQEAYPGWCRWVRSGETTLCEDFAMEESHNHIMYGDLFAWMMQYAAGFEPAFSRPGFREVVLKPRALTLLDAVKAHYDTIYGRIAVSWQRRNGIVEYHAELPAGLPGRLEAPDGSVTAINGSLTACWQ